MLIVGFYVTLGVLSWWSHGTVGEPPPSQVWVEGRALTCLHKHDPLQGIVQFSAGHCQLISWNSGDRGRMDECKQVLVASYVKKVMGFETVGWFQTGASGSGPYLRDKALAMLFLIPGR